jgi:uncharacterized protein (DUF983 family)
MSFVASVLQNKCPNCAEGNFFETNNPYNLKKFAAMNKSCPVCGMDFIQEPGFYFGAAIMSYVLQVGVIFILFAFFQFMIEIPIWYFIALLSGILILLAPLTFRISRLLWINMLGKKPEKKI